MILDMLENADAYAGIHPCFETAFAFFRKYTFLPDGTYELRGRDVFANVTNAFRTHQTKDIRLEAHREYI